MVEFEVSKRDERTKARRGRLKTPHGIVETPAFMPVATQGTVKTLSPRDLEEVGVQIIVSNTYHLHLRPGEGLIEELGGLHSFMGWPGAILTDSGGFQVHSLADLRKVTEEGVEFQSHIDGTPVFFTPEKVLHIQRALRSDVAMAFDEPLPYPVPHDRAERSLELTRMWAKRCKEERDRLGGDPALFGIVQGGVYTDLRGRGARDLVALGFDGYALGGLALGEPKVERDAVVRDTLPRLPEDKVRYLMGVGYPEDILSAVSEGADLFDCVLPTRNARTGTVFTRRGKLTVKNAEYARDERPIDSKCPCYTCRNFSRAYLRHLFNAGEILAPRLLTLHSVRFFMELMQGIRASIEGGTFAEWEREFLSVYREGA